MDPFYLGYKNNFKFEQEKRAMNKHKNTPALTLCKKLSEPFTTISFTFLFPT